MLPWQPAGLVLSLQGLSDCSYLQLPNNAEKLTGFLWTKQSCNTINNSQRAHQSDHIEPLAGPNSQISQVHDWLHQPRIPWHTYIPTQPNPTAPVAPSRLEDAACRALMASSCFSVARASGRGRIPGEGFRYIQIVAIFQQKLGKVKQRKGLGRTVNLKPP